jgi:ribosomal protein L22
MEVFLRDCITQIRGTWVPDALAQLKFSPKHRAVEVTKMVKVRQITKHFFDL